MDILYVVGNGSTWQNNELRYSLRSIEKNGVNVGRVYLVGHMPGFVSDLVRYIPCRDPYKQKHKNILYKTLFAVAHSDIDSHFLVSSDDHFYIKTTDFDKLPVYYRKEEIPRVAISQGSSYCKSLSDTRALLERYGFSIYQTNPHCNTHWNVDIYNRYLPMFERCMKLPYGGEMNCVMGNLLIHEGATPQHFIDAKLSGGILEEELENKIRRTNCISSVPDIENTFLSEWLKKEFPNKCIYEK